MIAVAPMSPYPMFLFSGVDGSLTNFTVLLMRNGCTYSKPIKQSRGKAGASKGHFNAVKVLLTSGCLVFLFTEGIKKAP